MMCCQQRHSFLAGVVGVLFLLSTVVTDGDGSDVKAQSNQARRRRNGHLTRLFPDFLKHVITDATRPIYHVWDQGKTSDNARSQGQQHDVENAPAFQVESTDEVEGARLLLASLQVVSTTFGLLADSVRVSGETAAGMVGSSVKLTGTAIKTISAGFSAASRALDPEPKQHYDFAADQWGKLPSSRRRKELTSERMNDVRYGAREYDFRIMRNTKKVAAKSIRLVGSVIDGFGESLLLAGAATEHLASTSFGVAESTVRIIEDFAGALSNTMSTEHEGRTSRPKHDTSTSNPQANPFRRNHTYINFGSRGDGTIYSGSSDNEPSSDASFISFWLDILNYLRIQLLGFPAFLYADTEGTPSLAHEFLLLFAFCYAATICVLGCSQPWNYDKSKKESTPMNSTVQTGSTLLVRVRSTENQRDLAKVKSPLTASSPDDEIKRTTAQSPPYRNTKSIFANMNRVVGRMRQLFAGAIVLAWTMAFQLFRINRCLLSLFLRVAFHKWTVVFGIYSFAWGYICRACQLRALSIQRNAESIGFRSAIDSIGISTKPLPESALWLNAVLSQVWRVPMELAAQSSPVHFPASIDYPRFVTRAMEPCNNMEQCVGRIRGTKSKFTPAYGGLEPYIASYLGNSIMHTLDLTLASRPKDVAYISLHSFTLGSHPPIAKSVKLLGVDKSSKQGTQLHLSLDSDVQLEDFSLVLEVKLSSLKYSMLPSTRIAVHAVSASIRLNMHLTFTPEFPFVSTMDFSLDEAPEINLRITPLDDGSGLRGVDVGSLPLIRAWVQDAVRQTLTEYVTPKYVSVDMVALLATSWQGNHCEATFHDTIIDIGRLRRTTGHDINTNPRTSIPEGLAAASVGGKLNSRDSAMRVISWRSGRRKNEKLRPALLVRPTTELSRLAMDRWLDANNIQVAAKPSAKKGIFNVVSYPWRKTNGIGSSLQKFFTPPRWLEKSLDSDINPELHPR